MGLSSAKHISPTGFSLFQNQLGVLKLLILFIFGLNFLSSVSAVPLDEVEVGEKREIFVPDGTLFTRNDEPYDFASVIEQTQNAHLEELQKREAGLFWGPIPIGNLKLSLTNPHVGKAGPKFPWANHVNFHVDKKIPGPRNKYSEVVNLHIVKYTSHGKFCLYAWDSVTKKTVFDNCFNDFSTAIAKCASAAKSFVDALLRQADFIASLIIISALVVALTALLLSLTAVVLV